MIKRILVVCTATALAACSSEQATAPAIVAERTSTELLVPARGELIASESLPIIMPGGIRMAFNISWIAPEYSEIRKGDVIARFDDVQIRLDQATTRLAVAKSDFKLANTDRAEDIERKRIGHETIRVDGEREISEAFATVDERLMSRNEMIDALSDLDYLDVEAAYLEWQEDTFDQRTTAERNLIKAERQGEVTKLEKQEKALNMMELTSPADGTLVYARTGWGEKLGKGKTVFPGRPVAFMPIRGKVKAKLYVPETDAVGISVGQPVRVRLDAASDREFAATVETVSPVASPKNKTDPQKFFIVEATIENVDPDLMRVGSRVRAEIVTGRVDDNVIVPAQSVYGDGDNAHVFVMNRGGYEERQVTLGMRSPDLIELVSGVEPGERISLIAPADATL
ncbi:MAG: efflux RND transporter periplasmic adaptor subunit [Woeseiaceae bacterium]|nr:efflux RND transporter periplasmic adaptor subunit [Woeseiaceae bacterium]